MFVIHSGTISKVKVWIVLCITLVCAVVFSSELVSALTNPNYSGRVTTILGVLFIYALAVYAMLCTIAEFRTIVISKDGCEITWWKLRKFYTWDQLWYRTWIEYTDYARQKDSMPAHGVIWFSNSIVQLPDICTAMPIVALNPMARVAIHFFPRGYQGDKENHNYSFAVDRKEFMDYMEYIGVHIENYWQARSYGDS